MHPWDHARSSTRRHGGRPDRFVECHGWFDATKVSRTHFTHRALRHHLEGIAESQRRFGDWVKIDEGRQIATAELGRQHLAEDLGRSEATAADWLECADPDRLPSTVPEPPELAAYSARRFGGPASAYLGLHAWFLETASWFSDRRHLIMRHHSFGIFEAEERFGIVLPLPDGHAVPTRVVAERHVRAVMGTIPSADALLRCIRPQRWMAAATSPVRLGLDRAKEA